MENNPIVKYSLWSHHEFLCPKIFNIHDSWLILIMNSWSCILNILGYKYNTNLKRTYPEDNNFKTYMHCSIWIT